jgi:glutamyl-tRNA synthetase
MGDGSGSRIFYRHFGHSLSLWCTIETLPDNGGVLSRRSRLPKRLPLGTAHTPPRAVRQATPLLPGLYADPFFPSDQRLDLVFFVLKWGIMSIVTRFPPSPTGPLHVGNVRSALFNYFFARQHEGLFVVRVEDTDRARSKKEHEDDMLDSLAWLGLTRDGELWHQSQRTEIYKRYLQKLIEEDKAYISHETEGENKEVVRFRNPNIILSFEDVIRGIITFDTTELGDFIIARNINEPVYHLAVVVDDFETGITHVIRGEDHVSNTPRQILIAEAIGAPRPIYAHLPLILAEDRSKLSKRKHGEAVSLRYYRERGYLPEAIVNFLALTGWNPGDDKELFTLQELIKEFSLEKVQKGGGVFNVEKLNWINKEYIKRLSPEDQLKGIRPFVPDNVNDVLLMKLLPVIIDRVSTWGDAVTLFQEGEFDYLFDEPAPDAKKLPWKTDRSEITKEHLTEVLKRLEGVDEASWSLETAKEALWSYAEEKGKGNVLWPTRMALTGKEKSPDPFTVASLLGKEKTLSRLESAIQLLS